MFRKIVTAVSFCALVSAMPARAHEELSVVASIKPIHSLVSKVMAGVAEPKLLLDATGSPHTWSLRPSQAETLSNADVVFWVGADLETFLVRPLEEIAANARVDELLETPGLELYGFREGGVFEGHDHGDHADHGHDDHAGHDHEKHASHDEHAGHDHAGHSHDDHAGHSHGDHAHHEGDADHGHDDHASHGHGHSHDGEHDPHIWLDPVNAQKMVTHIATVLADADPEHAAAYRENAVRANEGLAALNDEIAGLFNADDVRPFVVFHDAYQYFERRYGLSPAASITVNPDVPPGADRLRSIRARIGDATGVCVFSEPQFQPRVVEVIVEGTGADTGVLDPLGVVHEAGDGHYDNLLRTMATSFLNCGPSS